MTSKVQKANEAIVYIVDDDEGLRKALSLLMKTTDYKARVCASAHEFLEVYDRNKPGCLLLDVRMPEMSGLELQQRLAADKTDIPVVIMTGHADVSMAVQAMKNGARDFIEKPFRNQVLLDMIQKYLSEATERQQEKEKHHHARARLSTLTPRELEIMHLLADGHLNKTIAYQLGISVRTVEVHRANIMKKLHVKTLPELVRLALFDTGLNAVAE
jgi:two-component system response regulator FixJ